jgi:hypothetical protein
MEFYHVTTTQVAQKILEEGFRPDWGDAGLGVYFYDNLTDAEDYLTEGGWDGRLDPSDGAIVSIIVDEMELERIIPDPEWPNPEDYETVAWRPMDDAETLWKPEEIRILDNAPYPSP